MTWYRDNNGECPICGCDGYEWESGCPDCGHYDEDGHAIERREKRREEQRRRRHRRRW